MPCGYADPSGTRAPWQSPGWRRGNRVGPKREKLVKVSPSEKKFSAGAATFEQVYLDVIVRTDRVAGRANLTDNRRSRDRAIATTRDRDYLQEVRDEDLYLDA